MLGNLTSARLFGSTKFITNIVVILFIAQLAASLNVTVVSGRNRTTSCNLRLTREKVFIEEIEGPEDSAMKRKTRDNYGIVKLKRMSSNITDQELCICAKINLKSRLKICTDFLTANMNNMKSEIDSWNPVFRRIMCCYVESLIEKNEHRFKVQSPIGESKNKLMNISRNGVLKMEKISSEVTTHLPCAKSLNLFANEKNTCRFANEEDSHLQRVIFKNTESFGTSNYKVDEPKLLSLFHNLKKIYHTPLKIKDKLGYVARIRRSMETMENKRSRLKHGLKQVSNEGTTRKYVLPDSTVHNHNQVKGVFSSGANEDKVVEIPNRFQNYGTRERSPASTEHAKYSTTFVSLLDNYEIGANNKLDTSRLLSVPCQLKKYIQHNSKGNPKFQISQSCDRKSKKILNYDRGPVRLEKRSASSGVESDMRFSDEQGEFDRRYNYLDVPSPLSVFHYFGEKANKLSTKTLINNTIVLSDVNQNKVNENSTNANEKEKPRFENPSEKNETKLSKSSTDQIPNETKEKTQLGKESKNSAWNFRIPTVFSKYIGYVSSFYAPVFATDVIGNNDRSKPTREKSGPTHSLNISQEEIRKNVSKTNFNTLPDIGGNFIRIFTKNSFPNSTVDLSNSTKNGLVHSMEMFGKNATEMLFDKFSKILSTNSSDVDHAVPKGGSTIVNSSTKYDNITVNKTFPVAAKNALKTMEEKQYLMYPETRPHKLAAIISSTTRQTPRSINFQNFPMIHDHSDLSLSKESTDMQAENLAVTSSAISNFPLARNAKEIPYPKKSIMKLITNSANDLMKNSTVSTHMKSEDFSDKTTVNFTIIDPNCNPANNNSTDQSSIIFEIMVPTSTYPTLRRHSRNDTIDEIISPNMKIHHRRNNDGKTRQANNSSNNSRLFNTGKKRRGGMGMIRTKNRMRFEGKHPVGFINPSIKNGNNSSRKNNASAPLDQARLPTVYDVPIVRENGKSTAIPVLTELSNSSTFKKLTGSPSSTLLPPAAWREIHTSMSPPVNAHTHMSHVDSSKRPVELSDIESGHSDVTAKMTVEMPRTTFSTGESFLKEINDSYSVHSKVGPTMSTASPSINTVVELTDFFTITVPTSLTRPDHELRQDHVIEIGETSAKTLSSKSSTLLYDEFISVAASKVEHRDNSKIDRHSVNGNTLRNEETQVVDAYIKNENITEISTTLSTTEMLPITGLSFPTGKSHQELDGLTKMKIVHNIVSDGPSTFFYDKSNFTGSPVIDEIVPFERNKTKIDKSSQSIANQILVEAQNNSLTTFDEVFARDSGQLLNRGDSMKNQTTIANVTEEIHEYSSTTEQLT